MLPIPEEVWHNTLYDRLNKVKVDSVEGIKCYGRVYPKDLDDVAGVWDFEDFAHSLNNTLALMIYSHYHLGVNRSRDLSGSNILKIGLTSAVSILREVPEGTLPPEQNLDQSITTTFDVDLDKVDMLLLQPPLVMRLARLTNKDRFMILVYFNLIFKD